ncbi:Lipid II isoglutaminyl synthase (glutamine-hydrolyzing) subunit GatD [Streptomyces tendae]
MTAACTWAVGNGAIVFSVCAGYQILGHEFINDLGQREPGLGLLYVVSTRGEGARCVGDVLGDIDPRLGLPLLTGFENHQGVTHPGPTARLLAQVRFGNGNGTGDGTEGAYNDTVFGTYMHGPALAREPADRGPPAQAGPGRERAAADRRPVVRGSPERAHRGCAAACVSTVAQQPA